MAAIVSSRRTPLWRRINDDDMSCDEAFDACWEAFTFLFQAFNEHKGAHNVKYFRDLMLNTGR